MKRRRHFRGVLVTLECGHVEILPSCWWRLSAALVSVLVGNAVRRGVWCERCRASCHPQSIVGTCRL